MAEQLQPHCKIKLPLEVKGTWCQAGECAKKSGVGYAAKDSVGVIPVC